MTQISDVTPQARRNVIVLVIAQATLGAQLPMIFVLGGLAGQQLATNHCWATLPISMIVFGSMSTAPWMSRVMQRFGRKTGFFVGTTGGTIGAAIAAYAIAHESFTLFLLGSYCTGIYMSAHGFYRFAAIDTASESFRPKAMSYVMAGGLGAAVIGPQLSKITSGAADIPFLGTYLAVIAINVVGSLLFVFLDIPVPKPSTVAKATGRSLGQLLRTPRIAVAIICALVGYSLMNLIMTSTPLAVTGVGFHQNHAADVVMVHVLAMYVPSFFTGHLIVRYGVEKIVGIGLAILAGAGIVGLAGVHLMNFYVALALLGIGWNFAFIGATSLLASAHSVAERGTIQGVNDMIVFGFVTLASLTSGLLMNCSGSSVHDGWNAVNYAMVPFLILAALSLVWLIRNGRSTPTTA